MQFIETSREEEVVTRFQSAVARLPSCFLTIVLTSTIFLGEFPHYPGDIVVTALNSAQVLASLALIVAIFTIQRRPDVFLPDGKIVERQFTASLLARYTFSWSSNLLDLAGARLIEITDLPAMDAHIRSKESTASFRSIALKDDVSLWKLIFWSFWVQILIQWTLCILTAIFDVAPQFAMLKLLQHLEARKGLDVIDPEAWLCVLALFAATFGSTLIDSRIRWLMFSSVCLLP